MVRLMVDIEKEILRIFKGTYVNNYPCKGFKISDVTHSEGKKPINPFSVEKQSESKKYNK